MELPPSRAASHARIALVVGGLLAMSVGAGVVYAKVCGARQVAGSVTTR
jgi:hypothetical protein